MENWILGLAMSLSIALVFGYLTSLSFNGFLSGFIVASSIMVYAGILPEYLIYVNLVLIGILVYSMIKGRRGYNTE